MTGPGDQVWRFLREGLRRLHDYDADNSRGFREKAVNDLLEAWKNTAAALLARAAEYPGYSAAIMSGLSGGLRGAVEEAASMGLPGRLGEAAERLLEADKCIHGGALARAAEDIADAIEAVMDSDPATLCRRSRHGS